MNCLQCGYNNDQDAGFCENCGASLERLCPDCGSPAKQDARFCKMCGTALPEPISTEERANHLAKLQQSAPDGLNENIHRSSSHMEGERKPVTILFSDIVGSTSMAEKLDPEEWKEVVLVAHERISQAVYRYGGTIAQLLGDGVLAFFGAPVTHEDDPSRAVHAALDIQQAIGEYASELKGYVDNFQVRVGLNSGMVVVGNIGCDQHMEYMAIGDAVNLAARLQTAVKPGGVLISESTARQVQANFDLQPLGEITVKGRTEPVSVFEVLQCKAVPENTPGFTELSSPLVGRSCELGFLNEALQALRDGHGQIVSIIGEAGIGKSRLVEEARMQSMAASPQIHWFEGRALSYGQTLSFWTITQLIYSNLGLSDGDPEVRVRHALKCQLKEMFSEQDAEVYPYLAQLLGLHLEGETAEQVGLLDGESLKHQILLAVCRYFQRLAETRPTVLVFEDMQWADPSSMETLEELMAVTDRAPLMLLLLSRLEREHDSWRVKILAETDYFHRYTGITLKPLSTEEQNLLVDSLLAMSDLPDQTRQVILENSEGNPFYLEEVVLSLIDQGAFIQEKGRWRTKRDPGSITIPETLQGLMLSRIDSLQEEVRRTLQIASVIGKSFLFSLLEAVDTDEKHLDQHLALLQRADLVREKACLPELEYIFKHSLTQEAAYNSLLMEKRREFHQRVGEAIESLFSDRSDHYLGLLSYHFESAGDLSRATEYLVQAGDRARLSDEHIEAVGYYQRAIKLLENQKDISRLVQVWLKLGLIYHVNFQFEAAHEANEKAFALQKEIPAHEKPGAAMQPQALRFNYYTPHYSLDPGQTSWEQDMLVIRHLFSGLAYLDENLNLIPDLARSWQVFEDGRRFLFHLRSNTTWTDGTPVTAADFEWAWKRNLRPNLPFSLASGLFDVVGARAYNNGENPDPDSIGVHALDDLTLEVHLEQPTAYFPFIIAQPVAFPLPRKTVDTLGDDWWQPGNMVNNGPYLLKKFDTQRGCLLERNKRYSGPFPGNVDQVEWTFSGNQEDLIRAYQENQLDLVKGGGVIRAIQEGIPPGEVRWQQTLDADFLVLSPCMAPFDDIRVRKAFAMAFDRRKISEQFNFPVYRGGLVPPGMPGHSPELTLPYDPELARSLMAEAGYPGGKDFPLTTVKTFQSKDLMSALSHQWHENLGIEINIEDPDLDATTVWKRDKQMQFIGTAPDYPDPDSLLGQMGMIRCLNGLGWQDPGYAALVNEAARTTDRVKRMAMYREADRQLVAEQALVLPIFNPYGIRLVKPWVKNFQCNLPGPIYFHHLIIEEH